MSDVESPAAEAARLHSRIVSGLRSLRSTKVEVYFLLREFHDAKLFRHLELPMSAAHASKISAGRRFTTWEDYLAALGEGGICPSYFAELDRLYRRYGEPFVRLCAEGVPVRTRRQLVDAPERIAREVRAAASSGLAASDRIETVVALAGLWASERAARDRRPASDRARVAAYHRHVVGWERKLRQMVATLETMSGDYRGCSLADDLVQAWRSVFELHLEVGERLAKLRLSTNLSEPHAAFIGRVFDVWQAGGPGLVDEAPLPELPARRDGVLGGGQRAPRRRAAVRSFPAVIGRRLTHLPPRVA